MNIEVLGIEDVDFKEKDVQRAIEKDLSKLEESLEFIDSEVTIGTGRIDTLAFDRESNQPVFIEYKGRGQFSKDALIQLMDYLSWFKRNPNHMILLEAYIKKRKPDIEEIDPEIRIICLVNDIERRINNAIYALENWVKVYSYLITKIAEGRFLLIPKLEVDNSDTERPIKPGKSESEILGKHANLKGVFENLRPLFERADVKAYTTRSSLGFRRDKVYAKMHFRKRYILLELRVGRNKIADNDFKYWRQGNSSWGYTHIYESDDIQDKLRNWIDTAYNFQGDDEEISNGEESE